MTDLVHLRMLSDLQKLEAALEPEDWCGDESMLDVVHRIQVAISNQAVAAELTKVRNIFALRKARELLASRGHYAQADMFGKLITELEA